MAILQPFQSRVESFCVIYINKMPLGSGNKQSSAAKKVAKILKVVKKLIWELLKKNWNQQNKNWDA